MALLKRKKEVVLDQKTKELVAIVDGTIQSIENTPDAVFSQKMMGDGVTFIPTSSRIYACMDAEITMIFPTKHALGMRSIDGIGILIHVGLDTVELEGKPFTLHVMENQKVKAGDLLMEVDFEMIKAAGKGIHIPVVITNQEELSDIHFAYIYNNEITAKSPYCKINIKN